jgi:hypothetical protein
MPARANRLFHVRPVVAHSRTCSRVLLWPLITVISMGSVLLPADRSSKAALECRLAPGPCAVLNREKATGSEQQRWHDLCWAYPE